MRFVVTATKGLEIRDRVGLVVGWLIAAALRPTSLFDCDREPRTTDESLVQG